MSRPTRSWLSLPRRGAPSLGGADRRKGCVNRNHFEGILRYNHIEGQIIEVWYEPVVKSNRPGESLADGLPCESLHLDVEELSEVAEPFNHLRGHAAVKLDSGQESSRTGREQDGERQREVFVRQTSFGMKDNLEESSKDYSGRYPK